MNQNKKIESIASKTEKTKKSVMRRQAILAAAIDLFDRKGYANTSLDDVARAVGIKREALYYYFRSRSEMLLSIIGPQTADLVGGLQEVINSNSHPEEMLRGAIKNHLKSFDRHCLEMTISLRDGIMGTAPEVRVVMQTVWKEYEQMWTRLIEQGQAKGVFVKLGDPKMVAFAILGMCNWLSRWYSPRKSCTIDELINTYFNLISQGMLPREDVLSAPASRKTRAKR